MVLPALLALAATTGCKAKASAEVRAGGDGVDGSAAYGDGKGDGSWGDGSAAPEDKGRHAEEHPIHAGDRFVTLPGFRMFRDGSSRVFVEIGGDVAVDEARGDGQLVYTLRQVRVPDKVNLFDLPTTYFRTPVSRVRLVQLEGDAQLIIELRQAAHSKMHLQKSSAGTVLSVDFPAVAESNDDGAGAKSNQAPKP
jgi:hypothetical protein